MKKLLIAWTVAGVLSAFAGAARAETLWYKWADGKYSVSKYATNLYTGIRAHFGVWPVAWGHSAGAVFTDDGWASVNWTDASWEANVANGFGGRDEQWGVWMLGGNGGQYIGQPFVPFTFEFALYVRNSSGQWFWDNNRGMNHRIAVDSP